MNQTLEEVTQEDDAHDLRTVGAAFLEHVGVKGMKWGVRKAPDPERSASRWKARKDRERAAKGESDKKGKFKDKVSEKKGKADEKKAKTDDEEVLTQKQVRAKQLSDQQLRDSIARMQLEKQYNDLMLQTGPKKKKTKGQAFMDEAKAVGANVARDAARDVGGQLAKAYLREALGLPEPKKKK